MSPGSALFIWLADKTFVGPVLTADFRGASADFGLRFVPIAREDGPNSGLKLPGPSVRAVWDQILVRSHKPRKPDPGTGSIIKQPQVFRLLNNASRPEIVDFRGSKRPPSYRKIHWKRWGSSPPPFQIVFVGRSVFSNLKQALCQFGT